MKDIKIQNQSYLRNINQKTILKYLMKEKLSASDLAKKMKLSNTAIAKITDELVKNNILIKQDSQNNEVGRRPIMLNINPDCGVVYIINLAGRQAISLISDMSGKILCKNVKEITQKINNDFLFTIVQSLKEMHLNFCKDIDLKAICISTPGKIDKNTGNFLFAHNFENSKNINLKKYFTKYFDCKILIDNDLKLALQGEKIYGKYLKGVKNAMMLHIGYSVGSAIMINDKIYNGSNGFAGELTEFSLNTLVDSADMFFPKKLNSLNSVSVEGIKKTIRHIASANEQENTDLIKSELKTDDIINAYNNGNEIVKNILEQFAMIWARTIRNMTEFLDIETIIINGEIIKFGNEFINIVEKYVNDFLNYQTLKLHYTELEENGAILGAINNAITFSLENMLKDI